MFNIFKSKSQENNPPDWLPHLQETEQRWFVFLEKLEAKLEELCTAAIPELEALFETDDNVHKMNYHRVYSGIAGQIENIRKKAYDAYEDKILYTHDTIKSDVSVMSPHYKFISEFRNCCSERYHQAFDKKLQ